jgi:hypothetical protein
VGEGTGGDDVAFVERLMRVGVIALPGSFLDPAGAGYVRWALVPTLEQCREAVERMSQVAARSRDERRLHALGRGRRAGLCGNALARRAGRSRRRRRHARRARWGPASSRREARRDLGDAWLDPAGHSALFPAARREDPGGRPFEYHDKIPLKKNLAAAGVRVVPPGVARYGSFLEPGVILMPGYVNVGARVGEGTMIDTWATVGSCAQIGRHVHLSGGVGSAACSSLRRASR